MFGIGLPELIVLFVLALFIVPGIFYLRTLQKALSRCSPDCRTLSPGLVWLLIIPLFNLIWDFVVVNSLSKSLHNEFTKRNITEHSTPGRGIGLALCILSIVSMIPYLRLPAGLAALICWIVYWAKIARYSEKLQLSAG